MQCTAVLLLATHIIDITVLRACLAFPWQCVWVSGVAQLSLLFCPVLLFCSSSSSLPQTSLSNRSFSGYLFHHDLDFMTKMQNYTVAPKVFHMCWTESRKQKVEYFKTLGLWLLPEGKEEQCLSVDGLRRWTGKDVLGECCEVGAYFVNRPKR